MSTFDDLVDEAERRLAPIIRITPVEPSHTLTRVMGVPVWLKLECLQLTGSFKIRGAYAALGQVQDRGVSSVATCSAGNHGLGVALAARLLGMQARIFVPQSVDPAKASLLRQQGADLVLSQFQGFDDTELWARAEAEKAGLPFISAYDDRVILAGNGGTLMREIRRQVPDVDTVVVPVGGGGMAGGMALCDAAPSRLVAAQASASPALALSLERGKAVTQLESTGPTLAGGLEGGIGVTGFEALRNRVSKVLLVSEADLADGVRWVLEHHQYLIEPSSATVVAACLSGQVRAGGPVVVVLSGRNVSLDTLRRLMA